MDDQDKELCCQKHFGCLSSYERNIISNLICGATGIAVTALGIAGVSSPWIAFSATLLYTISHFVHKDRNSDRYKEQLKIAEQEMSLQEREIRRLSVTASNNSQTGSNKSMQTEDQFDSID